MCGIFGFCGKGNFKELIKNGLKDLEYRGYDSCGFVFLNGREIVLKKLAGKNKVEQLVSDFDFAGKGIAISHTRWATHGRVNELNAHPHFDCSRQIFVVHNGIIENYSELKQELIKKGHNFISETDTEVIPHLIEEYMKEMDFLSAVRRMCRVLEGAFAFVVVKKDEEYVVGARKGSPVVVGLEDGNFFIASDIYPISRYTDKFIFLDDDEMVCFSLKGDFEIYNFMDNRKVKKDIVRIEIKKEEVVQDSSGTFMMKEIHQQPYILKQTINTFLSDSISFFLSDRFKIPERIIFTGCGTSWHAGLVGEYMLENLLRIPVEVEYASEFRYRNPVIDEKCLLIPISQSGETADTIGAIKIVKGICPVISICNVIGSSIMRLSDFSIFTNAGPEIGVASTKAFTSQIFAIYLFALSLMLKTKKITPLEFDRQLNDMFSFAEKINEIFKNEEEIKKIADFMKGKSNALYLGRGIHFPVALEGALKLKEISYIHAEGYPAAEMKHGPIALIDENMPAVFIMVKDRLKEKILSNMEEVKARGGYIILVTDMEDFNNFKGVDEIIFVPEIGNDYLKSVFTVIPLQLLAAYTALKKGLDIDKPRNLAKSVTVE